MARSVGNLDNANTMANAQRALGSMAARPGARALVVLLAAVLATACGSSTRNRQAMMLAEEARAEAATNGDAVGTPGMVGPGGAVGTTSAAAAPPDEKTVDLATYRVAPGDLLDIKFPYHPEENQRAPVRNDGVINLPVTGDIDAAGRTVKEIEDEIVAKSSTTLRGPVVSVTIAQLAEHKVFVGGQVVKPGYVPFRQGLTSMQAIVERGGFLDDAKMDQIVHLHRVGNSMQTKKIDLGSAFEGTAQDTNVLAPNDILIVPRTWIGDADVFVDQWIRGLLPTIPRPGIDLPLLFF
jgi:protein involved in polysaccharide export with SLBB domain